MPDRSGSVAVDANDRKRARAQNGTSDRHVQRVSRRRQRDLPFSGVQHGQFHHGFVRKLRELNSRGRETDVGGGRPVETSPATRRRWWLTFTRN